MNRKMFAVVFVAVVCQSLSTGICESPSLLTDSNFRILPGIAQPKLRVTVYPPVAGIVQELRVAEGEYVKQSQILAILDERIAKRTVDVASVGAEQTGMVSSALAEVAFAERQVKRLESLERSRGVSLQEIDNGRLAYNKARANLKLARHEERLAASKLRLEQTRQESLRIRAPFEGQVIRLQLTEGQKVHDNTSLMELVNVSTLIAELYVPTELYDKLTLGSVYPLRAGTPVNRRVDALLKTKEPIIDAGTQTFRCVFEIDNSQLEFPAGFVVHCDHLLTDGLLPAPLITSVK